MLKINKLKLISLEKEKLAVEDHKNEMEKLSQKSRQEIEKLKTKYFDDLRSNVDEYEAKLTDLRLKYTTIHFLAEFYKLFKDKYELFDN